MIYLTEVPITLFILMSILTFIFLIVSVHNSQTINIVCGILTIMLSYILSKISINGMLVYQSGGISSADAIITDAVSIVYMPMSYIFLFVAIIATLITISNIFIEVKYNIEPDLDGDFDI